MKVVGVLSFLYPQKTGPAQACCGYPLEPLPSPGEGKGYAGVSCCRLLRRKCYRHAGWRFLKTNMLAQEIVSQV